MCNIKLSNLSPNLYQEAIKAAKENKVNEKIDYLINIASEKGFTDDEKKFLGGLASNVNLEKLKKGEFPSQAIDFSEPGISFETKNDSTATEVPKTKMEYLSKIFDENIVSPLKNVKIGVNENIQETVIESKIKSVESLGKAVLEKLDSKLPNIQDKNNFIKLYKNIDSVAQKNLVALLDGTIPLKSNKKAEVGEVPLKIQLAVETNSMGKVGVDMSNLKKDLQVNLNVNSIGIKNIVNKKINELQERLSNLPFDVKPITCNINQKNLMKVTVFFYHKSTKL